MNMRSVRSAARLLGTMVLTLAMVTGSTPLPLLTQTAIAAETQDNESSINQTQPTDDGTLEDAKDGGALPDENAPSNPGATESKTNPVADAQNPSAESSPAAPDDTEATDQEKPESVVKPELTAQAYLSSVGWQAARSGVDVTVGTVGKNIPVEALKVSLPEDIDGDLEIAGHVTNIGWQDPSDDLAGTTGKGLTLQAVRIALTGAIANDYDIYYRVHAADFGWLGWAKNGEDAGTRSYNKAMQAIEIKLIKKGEAVPDQTEKAFKDKADEPAAISYSAHVTNIGWMAAVSNGGTAGTTGRNLNVEAVRFSTAWARHEGTVEARAAYANGTWGSWATQIAGTTGKNLAISAIEIRGTGEVASAYDVWYRVHVANRGWLDWTSNGAPAGTVGTGDNIQAIQVVYVQKGGDAPGKTDKPFYASDPKVDGSFSRINGNSTTVSGGATSTFGNASDTAVSMESVSLAIRDQSEDGSILYQTRQAFSEWQPNWVSDGAASGATGSGLPLEAIRIKLSGEIEQRYDIWYRVFATGKGWLGWTRNGADAGSDGYGASIQALQVALVAKGGKVPGTEGGSYDSSISTTPTIRYQAHSTNVSWMNLAADGQTAGTTGKNLTLQALRVSLDNLGNTYAGSGIQISAHVTNIGWQSFVTSPAYAGTVGQNLAIQAIKAQLTGTIATDYDVYYRIHSADYGWLGWTKNGEVAGTVGLNKHAEAVEFKLVKKGEQAPVSSAPSYLNMPSLTYSAHSSNKGWGATVAAGGVAGATGVSNRIEALKLQVNEAAVSGGITYSAHVSDIGWQGWVSDGAIAGTTGQNRQIEAIKIKLTGNLSKYYDVWYRVHSANWGWLGWAANGAAAGTGKLGYRAEAVQIVLRAKGSAAPGSTARAYTEEPPVPPMSPLQQAMFNAAQGYSSATPWLILVDTNNTHVAIFNGYRGHWRMVQFWICSVGAPSTPTRKGVYTVGIRGYSFGAGTGHTCYYYTQFSGDYLFHSILYHEGTFIPLDDRMGMHISGGCVRLPIDQARWIYSTIPSGTTVSLW